ncbi:MAG: ribonuclease P protein component 1 [Thermoplasmatota archaeon]
MKRSVPRLAGPAKAFARSELVGKTATVVASPDDGILGLSGQVVDETLHTLVVRTVVGRRIRLAKAACTFEFQTPGSGRDPVRVDGRAIGFRSEDRTKKVR